jgi:hypothetical protein
VGGLNVKAHANSLAVGGEGTADKWALETLVKMVSKPKKITVAF